MSDDSFTKEARQRDTEEALATESFAGVVHSLITCKYIGARCIHIICTFLGLMQNLIKLYNLYDVIAAVFLA